MSYGTVVLVTGGRDYSAAGPLREFLDRLDPQPSLLIEGGARGADTLARLWAESKGIQVATMKANWGAYKRAAGFIRNAAMVRMAKGLADAGWDVVVVAFPGGAGTKNCIEQSSKAGLRMRVAAVEEW